jgi:hypothetical protein
MRTFTVHSLVAKAFLGPRPKRKEVNHLSGDKSDCSVENLEYATFIQNRRHAQEVLGLYRGARMHFAKLTETKVREIRTLAGTMSQQKIADRFGVTQANISDVLARNTWAWVL